MNAFTPRRDDVGTLFPPDLAAFSRGIRPAAAGTVPLPDLLRPDAMDALVRRYGESLGGTHRRAVLSRWVQYYMLVLIPPALARAATGESGPDLSLAGAGVALSPEGAPLFIGVPSEPGSESPLTALLRGHLQPLAAGLAACGLAPCVFWSNAGHVTAWALRILLAPPAVLDRIGQVLAAPDWCDGAPNPFAAAMMPARRGARSVCCLRHNLPGLDRCSNCPAGRRRVSGPAA